MQNNQAKLALRPALTGSRSIEAVLRQYPGLADIIAAVERKKAQPSPSRAAVRAQFNSLFAKPTEAG